MLATGYRIYPPPLRRPKTPPPRKPAKPIVFADSYTPRQISPTTGMAMIASDTICKRNNLPIANLRLRDTRTYFHDFPALA
jgi:hypothetical protein